MHACIAVSPGSFLVKTKEIYLNQSSKSNDFSQPFISSHIPHSNFSGGGGEGSGASPGPCDPTSPGSVHSSSSSQHQLHQFRHASQIPARSRAHSTATTPPSASHGNTSSGIPRRRTGSIGSAGEGPIGHPTAAAAAATARQAGGGYRSPARNAGLSSRSAASAQASEMQASMLSDVSVDGPAVQESSSRRRYRLADYIPTGVVDIAVSVEDINAYMVS